MTSLPVDGPSEPVVSFSISAFWIWSTLNYAGTGDAITRIGGGSAPVDAALDPWGTRLATRQGGGSPSFLLPDLHGNVAAIWSQGTSAWGDVFRYDPWGETIAAHTTGASRTPWRFQGRLVEGEPGDAELYDFGFRSYAADTGSFASLDDVAGGAHDVRSLNRFLYAHADPVTLIDPDGHAPQEGSNNRETMSDAVIKHQQQAAAQTQKAKHAQAKSSSADAGHAKKPPTYTMLKADTWWAGTQISAPGMSGLGTDLTALYVMCSEWQDDAACDAYRTGMVGGAQADLTGVAHVALDVGGVFDPTGTLDATNAGIYASEGDLINAGISGASAATWFVADIAKGPRLVGRVLDAIFGAATRPADTIAGIAARKGDEAIACAHSFAAVTLVRTVDGGAVPIAEVDVGDDVAALDPDDGSTAMYAVTATFQHDDPVTGSVVIDGEAIVTTPGHRFLTDDDGWVEAAALRPGDEVVTVDGSAGVVWSLDWSGGLRTMHDLTVETVHTFAVGTGGWVVHNCDAGNPFDGPVDADLFVVDNHGNVIPVQAGQSLAGSPDSSYLQVRGSDGAPTGLRLDGPHNRWTHDDPRALVPHAHVPGRANPDGTPWLSVNVD